MHKLHGTFLVNELCPHKQLTPNITDVRSKLASLCRRVAQLLRAVMGDVVHSENVLSGCACSLCLHDDQLQALKRLYCSQ